MHRISVHSHGNVSPANVDRTVPASATNGNTTNTDKSLARYCWGCDAVECRPVSLHSHCRWWISSWTMATIDCARHWHYPCPSWCRQKTNPSHPDSPLGHKSTSQSLRLAINSGSRLFYYVFYPCFGECISRHAFDFSYGDYKSLAFESADRRLHRTTAVSRWSSKISYCRSKNILRNLKTAHCYRNCGNRRKWDNFAVRTFLLDP